MSFRMQPFVVTCCEGVLAVVGIAVYGFGGLCGFTGNCRHTDVEPWVSGAAFFG